MMRLAMSVLPAVLALGCNPEGVIGKDTDGAGTGGGETSGQTSGQTSGASTGHGSGGAGGSTGGTGLVCPPQQPADACDVCLFASCCPEIQACGAQCDCIRTCVAEGHTLDSCKTTCGDDGGAYDALHQCQVSQCAADC
jgi:hypothetical protein